MQNAECMRDPALRHGMVGFGKHADGRRHGMTLVHSILPTSYFTSPFLLPPSYFAYLTSLTKSRIVHAYSAGEDMFRMMTAIVTKKQVKRVKQPDQRSG